MPFKVGDVMDQRIEFIAQALNLKGSFSELCSKYGISRPTGYKWVNRFKEVGSFSLLEEKSRRPYTSPSRTSRDKERAVIRLREKYGWGARKLEVLLKREGIELKEITINRILARNNLINVKDSHKPAVKRFERKEPNELWQMDFKGDYKCNESRCYPLSIIDDCSRYLLGLNALNSQNAIGVDKCVTMAFKTYGIPDAILIDHGIPWWSNTNSYGLTRFSISLIKQDIRLIYSAIRHPQTQGKVERFHRTLASSIRHHGKPKNIKGWQKFFNKFRREYNFVRPHESLSMKAPSSCYKPSTREYNPAPRKWEYPEKSIVRRLNTQGCLNYAGGRFFVCEALAGERVRIEKIRNRLLVSYRNMYIREINLDLGCTRALVHPKSSHL